MRKINVFTFLFIFYSYANAPTLVMTESLFPKRFYLGEMIVTSYRSVRSQTDSTPFITSIGKRVNSHTIAVSQDLLKDGIVKYGDAIYIEDVGIKFVEDCMNKRYKKRIDVWVPSYTREHEFHKKFGKRKLKIWKIQ